ncbi:angiopoietin-2-like [Saccostrea cucullata]|uniref:angiopoietin-2-like n=1 Tax=Saccostrea cuccullata TaxID=36930 RepID=UPI002ED50BA5
MVGAFVTVECVLLDGHSYTVILSRRNGKVDFNRSYGEYESGFGSPNTEMWLGNKYIHFLTSYRWSILRIELTYSNSSVVDVEYGHIQVLHPRYNYYLHIHDFSGNTSDMMSYLDGRRFGANDYDSGRCGCPILASGGWWCEHSCNTTCSLTSPYNGSPYYFGWDCASEVEANARLVASVYVIKQNFAFKGYVQHDTDAHVIKELSPADGENLRGFCPRVCVHEKSCTGFDICQVEPEGKCRLSNGGVTAPGNIFTQCGHYEKIDQIKLICDPLSSVMACLEHGTVLDVTNDIAPELTTSETIITSGGVVLASYLNCSSCECVSSYTDVSGVYEIQISSSENLTVECVMMEGHGYIVVLQRHDGRVNFNRTFSEYENGFGSPFTEMWLGNKYLSALTSSWVSGIRIELTYSDSTHRYVEYSDVIVRGASQLFQLSSLTGYSGNASDMLMGFKGFSFGAYDFDPQSCDCQAVKYGGWWHNCCNTTCTLTSPYNDPWYPFGWDCESETSNRLMSAKIMVRGGSSLFG